MTIEMEPRPARDFLAHCVASTTGNPLLERIRDRSAEATLAVYRLAKNAMVHAIDNDAVVTTAEQSAEILSGFAAEVGGAATITFVEDTVFVCGQLLRASRKVYEAATELGRLLGRVDVSEVGFEAGVERADLLAFATALAGGVREPARKGELLATQIRHVLARRVDTSLMEQEDDADQPLARQILRSYAVALMVMRQFFDAIASGTTVLPHRVKRLAQRLVVLTESGDPAAFGVLAMANAHRHDAGRAVQAALLSLVVGRQITTDRVALARLAMAALVAEAGRVRVAGPERRDRLVALPDSVEVTVPATTAAVGIATGGINIQNAERVVVAWEATWLERSNLLGPLYGGKSGLPQAQILRLVRRLLERLAPRDSSRPLSPIDALEAVASEPGADRALIRLLVRALGVIPASSVVEFETGEWAVVVGPSKNPEALHLPLVRLVTDRKGRALDAPKEVDLGRATQARTYPRIVNIIEPDRARFNVTKPFLTGAG
jgi:hypothetical protein